MPSGFQDYIPRRLSRGFLIAFAIVSILLMGMWSTEGEDGTLHRAQEAFRSFMAPVGYVSATASSAIDDISDQMADANADPETLTELQRKNAELSELLTQADEYRQEALRLEGLLNLKDAYKIDGVSARIIGRSTDAWNQTVTLDVGSNDGVERGLTVMGSFGVIGQVISVSPGSCTVRLITDPKSGVAAMVQSSRVDGVVRGSLSETLYLENVSEDANVSVGDVVLTSGLGGSYSRGLLIGTVVRIEGKASDGTRQIVVAPNERAASLEEAMVIFSASAESSSARTSSQQGAQDATTSDDQSGNSAEGGTGNSGDNSGGDAQ